MISNLSIAFISFTTLFTIFMPIVLAIVFYKKEKYFIGTIFTGAGVFFLFQIVIRIPILQLVLPKMGWYQSLMGNIILYAVFLGLTAGIFEEVGRFLAFKFVLKNRLEWKNGFAFGIGHGGIESIILIGLTYVSNLYISIMINNGMFDSLIAPSMPTGTSDIIKNQLINTPSYIYLVPSLERVFAMVIHIALSILIMNGIRKGKGLLYLIIAILLHMFIDTPAVLLSAYGLNIWFIEGYTLITALIGLWYIIKTKKEQKSATYDV